MKELKKIILAKVMMLLMGLVYLNGQEIITIKGQLKNLEAESVILASVYGNNQYVVDSSEIGSDGQSFSFDLIDTTIKHGLHYIVYRPSKEYFQLLIDYDQKSFSIVGDAKNLLQTIKFKGSKQNTLFYEYFNTIGDFNKEQKKVSGSDLSMDEKRKRFLELEKEVQSFQKETSEKNKGTLLGLIVQNAINTTVPAFEDDKNPELARYRFFRGHYFDFVDMNDERDIYTSTFFSKMDDYVQKYTVQHPDSVFAAIDQIMGMLENNKPAFRYFAAYFLNKYAKSNILGFDKVYVNIADAYYKSGKAYWMSKENLAKVSDNADFFRQNLIGEKAYPLKIRKRVGGEIDLYDIDAKTTVLIFWSPTCSHCKKELPKLEKLYDDYHQKGVEFVTLCTKKQAECWEFIDAKNLEKGWTNAQPISNFYKPYDLRTTPKIYVLDKEKKIRCKNIEIERLPKFIDLILKEEDDSEAQ